MIKDIDIALENGKTLYPEADKDIRIDAKNIRIKNLEFQVLQLKQQANDLFYRALNQQSTIQSLYEELRLSKEFNAK